MYSKSYLNFFYRYTFAHHNYQFVKSCVNSSFSEQRSLMRSYACTDWLYLSKKQNKRRFCFVRAFPSKTKFFLKEKRGESDPRSRNTMQRGCKVFSSSKLCSDGLRINTLPLGGLDAGSRVKQFSLCNSIFCTRINHRCHALPVDVLYKSSYAHEKICTGWFCSAKPSQSFASSITCKKSYIKLISQNKMRNSIPSQIEMSYTRKRFLKIKAKESDVYQSEKKESLSGEIFKEKFTDIFQTSLEQVAFSFLSQTPTKPQFYKKKKFSVPINKLLAQSAPINIALASRFFKDFTSRSSGKFSCLPKKNTVTALLPRKKLFSLPKKKESLTKSSLSQSLYLFFSSVYLRNQRDKSGVYRCTKKKSMHVLYQMQQNRRSFVKISKQEKEMRYLTPLFYPRLISSKEMISSCNGCCKSLTFASQKQKFYKVKSCTRFARDIFNDTRHTNSKSSYAHYFDPLQIFDCLPLRGLHVRARHSITNRRFVQRKKILNKHKKICTARTAFCAKRITSYRIPCDAAHVRATPAGADNLRFVKGQSTQSAASCHTNHKFIKSGQSTCYTYYRTLFVKEGSRARQNFRASKESMCMEKRMRMRGSYKKRDTTKPPRDYLISFNAKIGDYLSSGDKIGEKRFFKEELEEPSTTNSLLLLTLAYRFVKVSRLNKTFDEAIVLYLSTICNSQAVRKGQGKKGYRLFFSKSGSKRIFTHLLFPTLLSTTERGHANNTNLRHLNSFIYPEKRNSVAFFFFLKAIALKNSKFRFARIIKGQSNTSNLDTPSVYFSTFLDLCQKKLNLQSRLSTKDEERREVRALLTSLREKCKIFLACDSIQKPSPLGISTFYGSQQTHNPLFTAPFKGRKPLLHDTSKRKSTFIFKLVGGTKTVKSKSYARNKKSFSRDNPITKKIVSSFSGRIIKISKRGYSLQKTQPVLFYNSANLHVKKGEWVTQGSPILTLTHQTLITGDIVQGIPRIEQLFEAFTSPPPTFKDKPIVTKFKDSYDTLHSRLRDIFRKHWLENVLAVAVRKSLEEIGYILVEMIQKVYLSQGVLIADKHIEIIIRQIASKGQILDSGSTGLFLEEVLPLKRLENANLTTPGKKCLYVPAVMGLTATALSSDSFISAASFQETTRVLSRDAIVGKSDFLRGLKEKVVIGDLISAGTGLDIYFIYTLIPIARDKAISQ